MAQLVIERANRKIDGLKLYKAMPAQETFHASMAYERILRAGNRGGKTLCACVEVARAATGCDPYDKYPKKDGRAYIVGYDSKHVANVMYPMLFKAGAFWMIRDEKTGKWRSAPAKDDKKKCKPVPPLIPPRFVKTIAWENKKAGQPSKIVLTNGWELYFYTSGGAPQRGSQADLVWFDEEIENDSWYPEMSARLIDRAGRFIWSATPQAGTDQLYRLHERATEESLKPAKDRIVEEIFLFAEDNAYIGEAERKRFEAKLSEEDYLVRVKGEFAHKAWLVYPEFSKARHVVPYFEVPGDWTRYASVDPGRQVCAVCFLAVPPPGHERKGYYVYDELYIVASDAEQFGQNMALKCQGQQIEAFIYDDHGGGVHEMGSGKRVIDWYSEALQKYRVSCVRTGHKLEPASDDKKGGVEAVRLWLRTQEYKEPALKILESKAENLVWEMQRFRYKKKKSPQGGIVVSDDPVDVGRVHQCANLRYLALYTPAWVPPKKGKVPLYGAAAAFKRKMDALKKTNGEQSVNVGPGSFYIGVGS